MNDINEIEFERGIQDCRMGEPSNESDSESRKLGYSEEYSYQEAATARTES